jgi:hypothetical protein
MADKPKKLKGKDKAEAKNKLFALNNQLEGLRKELAQERGKLDQVEKKREAEASEVEKKAKVSILEEVKSVEAFKKATVDLLKGKHRDHVFEVDRIEEEEVGAIRAQAKRDRLALAKKLEDDVAEAVAKKNAKLAELDELMNSRPAEEADKVRARYEGGIGNHTAAMNRIEAEIEKLTAERDELDELTR